MDESERKLKSILEKVLEESGEKVITFNYETTAGMAISKR